MSKQIMISPEEMRRAGTLQFADIPVNAYQKTVADEKDNFTTEEFLNIYRDMCYIREFETMLNEYYQLRGWDGNGIPTTAKLKELGLEEIGKDLPVTG